MKGGAKPPCRLIGRIGQFLDKPDGLVAKVAARQHGVIRTDQLYWAGLSPTQVKLRARDGRLHRLYRGVYAVGHPKLGKEGRWIAAVFACGKGAVLSHGSAAHLWSLTPKCPSLAHVTIPSTVGRASRKGIALHRSSTLGPRDVTRRRNIPVTTEARTLADMGWGRERSRSDLERDFLRLVRASGLPLPEANAHVGRFEVDFLWRSERLAVEVDGYRYQSDRTTFVADRAKDRELRRRGFDVMRFADEEIDREPEAVIASLRAQLMRSSRDRRSDRRP